MPRRVMIVAIMFFAAFVLAKPKEPGPETTATNPSKPKRIFDFKLTPDMKTADFDDPNSRLSKLTAFIAKGKSKASDYLSIIRRKNSPTEVQVSIKDDSIFVPGDKPENAQNGFRRTDMNMAIRPNESFTGITTFYQTIRFDEQAPLNLTNGYLLTSIEVKSGDHVFDIFAGSDFDSNNVAQKPSPNSRTIRVRDLATKELYSLPLNSSQPYNFAITVNWDSNMLTVYASTGKDPLKMVKEPGSNDPKVKSSDAAKGGEYHIQLIRFPLPDPKVPVGQRGDVPHKGIQNHITAEHVFFSNIYVTAGEGIQQPTFSSSKKSTRCRT